jgi:hypothetical protein
VAAVDPADVVALCHEGDGIAELIVPLIRSIAKSYTRSRGFDEDDAPNAEIAAVITTASARLFANPEQLPYDVGAVSMRGGFNGFNLAELAVLNRYRKRAE